MQWAPEIMYDLTTYGCIAAILVLAAILTKLLSSHVQSNSQYPPGPPKRLFFGNLGEIPRKKPWLAYTEWAKMYGDVMYLKFMKDDVIVLSSIDVARDLFDKRSRVYSGRPNENIATV
ncbi:hypothetical protein VNI00_010744 [Paramarasmius palmivorus]|uniref:Cytochrome P450 n=1 Tax=Paramarasmius palmivorus TaxID=297713 RepID=A0AAW0CIG0_9AGAR